MLEHRNTNQAEAMTEAALMSTREHEAFSTTYAHNFVMQITPSLSEAT